MHKFILQSRLFKPTPLRPELPAPAVEGSAAAGHTRPPAGTLAVNTDRPGRADPASLSQPTAQEAGGTGPVTHAPAAEEAL